MKKQSLSLLAISLMTVLAMPFANAGTGGSGGTNAHAPGTSGTGIARGAPSSFGTVVNDSDLTAKIPGRPKKVNGSKVQTSGGPPTLNATIIPSKASSGNMGFQDSTMLSGESSFSQGLNHKMEEFQTTKTRTKPADPTELHGCAQGYLYDLSKGGCYLPDPECPGNPIKKVWDSAALKCVCPVATPTWNGISCLTPCGPTQVFDGVSCVAGTASCTPTTQTQSVACGTGFTGNKTQTRALSCPANTWSAWVDSNTSLCVPTASCTPTTQTQSVACGTGFTGNKTQQRDYTCPAATWSGWVDSDTSLCVPTASCTPTTQTQSVACDAGFTGNKTQQRDYTCPANTWGGWVDSDTSLCVPTASCTPTTQTQSVACDAGYTGSITQQRDYTCPAAAWGSWYNVSNTCTVIPAAPALTAQQICVNSGGFWITAYDVRTQCLPGPPYMTWDGICRRYDWGPGYVPITPYCEYSTYVFTQYGNGWIDFWIDGVSTIVVPGPFFVACGPGWGGGEVCNE